jgi:hypothetical protein
VRFSFIVQVDIKNDATTQDCEDSDLAAMLIEGLEDNRLSSLSWVIDQNYRMFRKD